jgi:hypothetical protein
MPASAGTLGPGQGKRVPISLSEMWHMVIPQEWYRGEARGEADTMIEGHIQRIDHPMAKLWVETWHYSKRMPTGKNIPYGLFLNGQLYAVIVYGIGVNPYQANFLGVDTCIEIKRLARSEPRLDFPLSRFISVTAKMVHAEYPYDCIVALADPEHGHYGTIYKASGFTLHGMTNAEWHLEDKAGERRHRRYAFRHARRNGNSLHAGRKSKASRRVRRPANEPCQPRLVARSRQLNGRGGPRSSRGRKQPERHQLIRFSDKPNNQLSDPDWRPLDQILTTKVGCAC